MARAPINILVLPFRLNETGAYEYAVLKRVDKGLHHGIWQFISGGAEDNETKEEAAKRETLEETGISSDSKFYKLDSEFTVPRFNFPAASKIWPKNIYAIPNYCYAVDCSDSEIILSHEHSEYKWCLYQECHDILHFLSNKNALWELQERLNNDDMLLI
jgi:dihydroneopterin triphosphate diphosphatase